MFEYLGWVFESHKHHRQQRIAKVKSFIWNFIGKQLVGAFPELEGIAVPQQVLNVLLASEAQDSILLPITNATESKIYFRSMPQVNGIPI